MKTVAGKLTEAYGYEGSGRFVSFTLDRLGRQTITNTFAYNPRSELISALMGTNQYGYAFDPIGNRTTATNNAEAFSYAANSLNQYTNISDGGVVIPLYDFDGNLTNYAGWVFTWDAENRLISAANGSTVVSNQYDYMSRRVTKTSGGTARTFLYDGWNMVQENAGTATNMYIWGLDLSGSSQGAGGIGGLLSANLSGTRVYYFYDANGNATDLVNTNGTVVAHYEFEPYGNITVQSGNFATVNPFRFSTKYFDAEVGLYNYGRRYYHPEEGRWLSRDPLGENGGLNLTGFEGNNLIGDTDPLGQQPANDVGRIYFPDPTQPEPPPPRGRLLPPDFDPHAPITDPSQPRIRPGPRRSRPTPPPSPTPILPPSNTSGLPNLSSALGFSGSIAYYMPFPPPASAGGGFVSLTATVRQGKCCQGCNTKQYLKWEGQFIGGLYAGNPGLRVTPREPIVEFLPTCPATEELTCSGVVSATVAASVLYGTCSWSYGSGWACNGGLNLAPRDWLRARVTFGGGAKCSRTELR